MYLKISEPLPYGIDSITQFMLFSHINSAMPFSLITFAPTTQQILVDYQYNAKLFYIGKTGYYFVNAILSIFITIAAWLFCFILALVSDQLPQTNNNNNNNKNNDTHDKIAPELTIAQKILQTVYASLPMIICLLTIQENLALIIFELQIRASGTKISDSIWGDAVALLILIVFLAYYTFGVLFMSIGILRHKQFFGYFYNIIVDDKQDGPLFYVIAWLLRKIMLAMCVTLPYSSPQTNILLMTATQAIYFIFMLLLHPLKSSLMQLYVLSCDILVTIVLSCMWAVIYANQTSNIKAQTQLFYAFLICILCVHCFCSGVFTFYHIITRNTRAKVHNSAIVYDCSVDATDKLPISDDTARDQGLKILYATPRRKAIAKTPRTLSIELSPNLVHEERPLTFQNIPKN